jgi:hypothetical protein
MFDVARVRRSASQIVDRCREVTSAIKRFSHGKTLLIQRSFKFGHKLRSSRELEVHMNQSAFYPLSRQTSLRRRLVLLPVFLAAFTVLSSADLKHKPWVDKEWTKWTEWDCDNTLHYSPWVWYDEGGGRETGPIDYDPRFDLATEKWIRITSALPIRQAILRQLQLKKHYDKMDPETKKAFDFEHSRDLADGADGHIRLFVGLSIHGELPPIDSPAYRMRVAGALPARYAALSLSNGTLILPVEINVLGPAGRLEGSATEYVFPRLVDGKPVFSSEDSSVLFVFGEPIPAGKIVKPQLPGEFHIDRYAPRYSFPITSLMYKGKLEY